jgi:transposase
MIDPELRARIRRLFFAEHWKVGTIASELGVHHETVERAIEVERFTNTTKTIHTTLLDPYKQFLRETLEQHPRLRATRLFEMVRERGYVGGVTQLRRYVRKIRPTAHAEAYLRLETLPGEQAQVDWGHFGKIKVGHAVRPLSCFVMVLSFSRAVYARFTLDQTLESFLRGHVSAFEYFSGVSRTILYDNLKSVVLERVGDHVRFHPHLLEFAGHYHFAPKPCAPYRGNEKGKVERTIQYLRHAFFAARYFSSIDDLNRQLLEWIDRVAFARPVPAGAERKTVRDTFEQEKPLLLPLPQNRFETDLVRPVVSGKQPYVRFDLNDYSIPPDKIRTSLLLVASESSVRIFDGQTEIARHRRSYDRRAVIEDQAHLKILADQKRKARDLRGRDRLRGTCPSADAFIDALARRGDSLSTHTTRLASLLDRYGAVELEAAIKNALDRGAVSADSVAQILDQRARQRGVAPSTPIVLPDDPRVRDLRVTPHALGPYDALAQRDSPEDSNDNSH